MNVAFGTVPARGCEHNVELAETRDLIQLIFATRRDDLDSVLLHEGNVAGERAAVAPETVARGTRRSAAVPGRRSSRGVSLARSTHVPHRLLISAGDRSAILRADE